MFADVLPAVFAIAVSLFARGYWEWEAEGQDKKMAVATATAFEKATDKQLKKGPTVSEHRGAGVWGETPGRAVEATTALSDSNLTKAWCNCGETAEISPLAITCLRAHCYTTMTGHPD